jgi:hypothetical protein
LELGALLVGDESLMEAVSVISAETSVLRGHGDRSHQSEEVHHDDEVEGDCAVLSIIVAEQTGPVQDPEADPDPIVLAFEIEKVHVSEQFKVRPVEECGDVDEWTCPYVEDEVDDEGLQEVPQV